MITAKDRRERLAEQLRDMVDTCRAEYRDFTFEEKRTVESALFGIEGLENRSFNVPRNVDAVEQFLDSSPLSHDELKPGRSDVNHQFPETPTGGEGIGYRTSRTTAHAGERYVDPKSGREIRLLRPTESYAEAVGVHQSDGSAGRLIRGRITGNWTDAEYERRLNIGITDTSGGYLLPEILSTRFLDLVRNQSVMMRAGTQTIPMESANLSIARLTSDPTATWRGEGVAIPTSTPTVGRLNFSAYTCATLVGLSLELVEDASNASQVIENACAQALAVELDRSMLRGTGGGKPLGIRNYGNGAGTTDISGAITFDAMLDGMTQIESANHVPNAVVMSAETNNEVRKLKDGSGAYLTQVPDFQDLQRLVTNAVPDTLGTGSQSDITLGNFEHALLALRRSVRIEVFRAGSDSNGDDAVSQMLVWIRAYLRADFGLAYPAAFHILTNVNT